MSAFDPNLAGVSGLAMTAGAQGVQNNASVQALEGQMTGTFNGTIGDLQKNYPQVYQLLVVQTIAYQICQQCKQQSDDFVEQVREEESQG